MKERHYSVHDILRFSVRDTSALPPRLCNTVWTQLEAFQVQSIPSADFVIETGPFDPENKGCFVLDDTYHVKEGYFYCADSRKFAKWQCEISHIGDRPLLRIHGNAVAYYTAIVNIIDFWINYELIKRNRPLIHASGVLEGEKAVLFAARGGGGKTTLALTCIEMGMRYLSDNYMMLINGSAMGFVSPLNIFFYNRLKVIEDNLRLRQRLSMQMKAIIYRITGGYIKIFEKINPLSLFPQKVGTEGEISKIYLLEPHTGLHSAPFQLQPIDKATLVRRLRYNMELDLHLFNRYIYSYSYAIPKGAFSVFWEAYEKAVNENLPEPLNAYVVQVPTRYSQSQLNSLLKLLMPN